MNDTLPALPESVGRKCINAGRGRYPVCDVYTADQMHAYARAALEQREAEVARLQAELDFMTAHYERQTAYMVNHRGTVIYASAGMRDAYSDEHVQANAAESRLAAVEAFAQRLATDRSYSGDIVEDLRAALSGNRITDFFKE